MTRFVTIFDLEYTAWKGSMGRDWSGRINGKPELKEIVQIGALRIDPETLTPIAPPLDVLSFPNIHLRLSAYLTKLTGISNVMLTERGLSFPAAFKKFQNYCAGDILCAFGSDPAVLNTNLALNSMPPLNLGGFNINAWAQENGHTPPDGSINSGIFAKHVGADFTTKEHYAINDVYSILEGLRHLVFECGVANPLLAPAVQNNLAFIMPPP